MTGLRGKTLFVTGASRGIGLAIAERAARDGASIVIAAKTDTAHRKLPGTIHTAAAAILAAGGRALPVVCDVRDEASVQAALAAGVAEFGGIDVVVNNASAISLTDSQSTPMRRFDLMHAVNTRGTYLTAATAVRYLERSVNPHILNLAPPLNLDPRWFGPHLAYSIAKYGMSLCTLGLARELRPKGIACNSLWPKTIIDTAALGILPGIDRRGARSPSIVADAAAAILVRDSKSCSGNFFIDEDVLVEEGVSDFSGYAVDPTAELTTDLFLD